MNDFHPIHIERNHAFMVALPVEEAFLLFTPEGERAWAEGWEPRYLHPPDGRTQRGMVFTTGHGGEETTWTMTRHEPEAGVVEYARITPGVRAVIVRVECTPLEARRTRATVTYEMTALSEEGNRVITAIDEAVFRDFIASWERAIAAVATPS